MRNVLMASRTLQFLVAAFVAAPAAYAQVYKWTDDKGVVNYSSTPPDNRKSQKLDEDKGRVSTIEAQDLSKAEAASRERALRNRVDRLEQEAERNRQTAASQDAANAEAFRQWRERCISERRTDCDNQNPTYYDPGYYQPWVRPGVGPGPQRPGPGQYRPTGDVAVGGGGVVGPYSRPPPSGVVVGPGPGGVGAAYGPAAPGGVVVTPGTGGVGATYRPVPEDPQPYTGSPPPRPTPRR
jgi:hypothetical protein